MPNKPPPLTKRIVVWPCKWAARDDANLLDANGNYVSPTISVPAGIKRVLLRACHNSDNITFALQVRAEAG